MTSLIPLYGGNLETWLGGQRWFRSKSRPLREVGVRDFFELDEATGFLVIAASFDDDREERYLVPAVSMAESPREPADGDGLWRAVIAAMADGPRILSSSEGRLALKPRPPLAKLLPGGIPEASQLTERSMGVEQSNTAVALGDRLLLKIYRLLEPGINPEVEVLAFLTEQGFAHAPLAVGSMRYVPTDAEPATAGVIQSLVPAHGDGWAWMLAHLERPAADPQAAILAASGIGAVTVALHEALQSDPDRPDFPSRPARVEERRAWQAAAEGELDAALAALPATERPRLAILADSARAAFEAMTAAPAAWCARIHGDYHLGQLLVTDEGFVVTDFEGEPARPLAERRRPASPLRDVAGMLRSLDYVARTVQRRQPGFDADDWLNAARTAFLTAYGEPAEPSLLRAFELEKACYEVRYEANFRPDWSWLPLDAIERMVA
ncbi:MAG TPA: hypothetical protein VJY85_12520 [Candidatus Limnocylindria bacterium]|nr:hypothetical protein [Candidatus Limnocylindria bacterium]